MHGVNGRNKDHRQQVEKQDMFFLEEESEALITVIFHVFLKEAIHTYA